MNIYKHNTAIPVGSNEANGSDITGESTENKPMHLERVELHEVTQTTIEGLRKIVNVAPSTPFDQKEN